MRIPQALKDLLDASSEQNRRSMTAEVVARLQQTFGDAPGAGQGTAPLHQAGRAAQAGDETLETVKRIEQQLQMLVQSITAQGQVASTASQMRMAVPEDSTGEPASRPASRAVPKK